jgi:hypothetical protein
MKPIAGPSKIPVENCIDPKESLHKSKQTTDAQVNFRCTNCEQSSFRRDLPLAESFINITDRSCRPTSEDKLLDECRTQKPYQCSIELQHDCAPATRRGHDTLDSLSFHPNALKSHYGTKSAPCPSSLSANASTVSLSSRGRSAANAGCAGPSITIINLL